MLRPMMTKRCSRYPVLLAALAAAGVSSFADDLDAALAAQKKKVQPRVYSERAQLDDQNLTVPRAVSAEEKALDKELRAMEAKQDAKPATLQLAPPRPAPAPVRPAEDQNWLTAALAENEAKAALTNAQDDSWLRRDMERKREQKVKEELAAKENKLIEKQLREKKQQQQQAGTPELDSLKKYQLVQPTLFGEKEKETDRSGAPSYSLPQNRTPDPLAIIRPPAKNETKVAPPLFSPEASRLPAASNKDPLQSIRNPALGSGPAPAGRSAPVSLSPHWNEPETRAPTPLEVIRKSSPINRADPFADERIPQFKTSIWE